MAINLIKIYMKMFIGLGNPGIKFEKTRHNAGFMIIDKMAEEFSHKIHKSSSKTLKSSLNFASKFSSLVSMIEINATKVLLAKPQTFINCSGGPVSQIMAFYKINPNNIWVFHDDLDLEVARIKVKVAGSSAGHNGIKSIDQTIGKNYNRVRIGIRNSNLKNPSNFVLEEFSKPEFDQIEQIFKSIISNIDLLLKSDIDKFLNKIKPV